MKVDVSKGFELGGFGYKIDMTDVATNDLIARDCYGEHNGYTKVIRVANNVSTDQVRNTFIHECIEGVNVHYCNSSLKHSEITNLANGLAQVFKCLGIEFVNRKGR